MGAAGIHCQDLPPVSLGGTFETGSRRGCEYFLPFSDPRSLRASGQQPRLGSVVGLSVGVRLAISVRQPPPRC